MNETLIKEIEALGFVSGEAFLRWQFTKYLLEKSAELEAEIQVYKDKYGCDYETFEKRFSPEHPEVFEEWDDGILWEFMELELKDIKKSLFNIENEGLAMYSTDEAKRGSTLMSDYHQKLEQEHGTIRQFT
ncbi:MAG: hypothetical protein F6K17_38810 [Okeania sp. SIO3C4]|nr:hypothetical protein [Okeania sp. SIO3C4]